MKVGEIWRLKKHQASTVINNVNERHEEEGEDPVKSGLYDVIEETKVAILGLKDDMVFLMFLDGQKDSSSRERFIEVFEFDHEDTVALKQYMESNHV